MKESNRIPAPREIWDPKSCFEIVLSRLVGTRGGKEVDRKPSRIEPKNSLNELRTRLRCIGLRVE